MLRSEAEPIRFFGLDSVILPERFGCSFRDAFKFTEPVRAPPLTNVRYRLPKNQRDVYANFLGFSFIKMSNLFLKSSNIY